MQHRSNNGRQIGIAKQASNLQKCNLLAQLSDKVCPSSVRFFESEFLLWPSKGSSANMLVVCWANASQSDFDVCSGSCKQAYSLLVWWLWCVQSVNGMHGREGINEWDGLDGGRINVICTEKKSWPPWQMRLERKQRGRWRSAAGWKS